MNWKSVWKTNQNANNPSNHIYDIATKASAEDIFWIVVYAKNTSDDTKKRPCVWSLSAHQYLETAIPHSKPI